MVPNVFDFSFSAPEDAARLETAIFFLEDEDQLTLKDRLSAIAEFFRDAYPTEINPDIVFKTSLFPVIGAILFHKSGEDLKVGMMCLDFLFSRVESDEARVDILGHMCEHDIASQLLRRFRSRCGSGRSLGTLCSLAESLLRAVSAVAGAPDAADFADRVLWGLRGNIALHLLHFPGWEEGIPELWSFLRVLATCGTRATERFVRFVADGLANVLDSIDVEHDRGFSGLANLLTMVDAFLSSNAPVSLSRLSFAHFLLRVIAETPDPLSGETALRICQDRMTPDDFSALVDPAWLPAVMVHRPELESAAISIAYDVFSRASDVDDWVNYAAEVFGLGGKESEVQLPQPCKVFYAVCISVGCTTIPGLDLPPAAVFLPLLVDLLGSLMPPGLDAGLLLSLLEQYASLSYDDEETCEIFIEALDDTIAEAALAEYGEKGLDIVESVRNAAQALSDSRNYT